MSKSPKPEAELVRLSKVMSERGLCSRREADRFIEDGLVQVDGEVVSQLGSKVLRSVEIQLLAKAQQTLQEQVSVVLNKPVGYLSQETEKDYPLALNLLTKSNYWVSPDEKSTPRSRDITRIKGLGIAGRLDIDSQGLLILTQNGSLAKRIIGENTEVEKEYLVRVKGSLSEENLKRLNHGLSIDGKPLKPAKVSWQNKEQLKFILREGKKRQIRKMCDQVGLKVTGLKRVRVGGLRLGDLPEGKWRFLSEEELKYF